MSTHHLGVVAASGLAGLLLLGCGGDGGTGPPATPPPTPPPPPVPASISVWPDRHSFTALGDSLDLRAEVRSPIGGTLPNETVTWVGGDRNVAIVRSTGTQTGRVISLGTGQTYVGAAAGGVTASISVTVTQRPASLALEGDDLLALRPGASVRVSGHVRDRNGYGVPGVRADFRVEEGGGTVDPSSATTDADGQSVVSWTLGTSSTQALSMTADTLSTRFAAPLCSPLPLGAQLRLGEPRVLDPADSACGVSVSAPEEGTYYRATLVSFVDGGAPDDVTLTVGGGDASAGARRVVAAPPADVLALSDPMDPHGGAYDRNREVFSWMARPDGPRPLPDLGGRLSGRREDPPQTREFRWGQPGTLEDNCRVGRSFTGVLLAHNDDIAIYADDTLSPPIAGGEAQVVADIYEAYGAPTIRAYFPGTGDVDGDGRVLVLVQDMTPLGFVWAGNLLSTEDCPASNQAELIYVDEDAVRPGAGLIANATRTVVHEAKHVSSHHQHIRRAEVLGRHQMDIRHPAWIEEGTAEIAAEVAARLGWEAIGGPPPGAMVTSYEIRGADGTALHMWTPEVRGIRDILEAYGVVIAMQPNSITEGNPYGAGWGFFRFLGDWIGGAGRSRLGDAGLFARLNDATTQVGMDGLLEVTGRTFEELMIGYAQAVSLAGTGAPDVAGVPRFSTYDMTGLGGAPFLPYVLTSSRFPYPVTTVGWGTSVPLWRPMAEPLTISGPIGPNGFRVHDFRAENAGDETFIRVDGPEHVRLIITRLPDQKGR